MIFAPILMKNPDGSSIKTSRANVNRKFSQIPHFFAPRRAADAQAAGAKSARGRHMPPPPGNCCAVREISKRGSGVDHVLGVASEDHGDLRAGSAALRVEDRRAVAHGAVDEADGSSLSPVTFKILALTSSRFCFTQRV